MKKCSLLVTLTVLLLGCSKNGEVPATRSVDETAAATVEPVLFYTVDDYDPDRDAATDLAMTVERASADNKRIILEVGGQW